MVDNSLYFIDMEYCTKNLHDHIRNNSIKYISPKSEREFVTPSEGSPERFQDSSNFFSKAIDASEGGDLFLGVEIQSEDDIDWELIDGILYNIISGLKYIHGKKVVHRDLKPQNGIAGLLLLLILVLYSEQDRCWKLADVGNWLTLDQRVKPHLKSSTQHMTVEALRVTEHLMLSS